MATWARFFLDSHFRGNDTPGGTLQESGKWHRSAKVFPLWYYTLASAPRGDRARAEGYPHGVGE